MQPEGSAGSGLMAVAWFHVLLCWRPLVLAANRARRSAGTLVSALLFISLANYRAPLRGWQLPSRLCFTPPWTRPYAAPWLAAAARRRSLSLRRVNTYLQPFAACCCLTQSPRILHTDRPYFLLREGSVTGPLHCYRWRAAGDTASGLQRLLLLCVRQLCCLLGDVSGWWLLPDLVRLSITSIMKPALPLQLPLNGKRCLAGRPCLWFHVVAGIWSLTRRLFWWPAPLGPDAVAQRVARRRSLICCPVWSSLIWLCEQVGEPSRRPHLLGLKEAADPDAGT